MRIHNYALKSGISRTHEFERKKLASYAVNCGIKCGHNCLYCSSGTMLRMHPGFKKYGENPFRFGYAIVDPTAPDRVAQDARRIKKRGLIQLCTITDIYAPEVMDPQQRFLGQAHIWVPESYITQKASRQKAKK